MTAATWTGTGVAVTFSARATASRPSTIRDSLPISGAIGSGSDPPSGCRLRDRCPHAFARCATEEPRLVQVAPGHSSACHLHEA